ncbi:hypothetical protein DC20_14535 [Rufibacter tibetensis]|uniref:histidine kinase n=2 Tax=Rufibacter tibetensis TaxID=512763 RepID=A0A0P0CKB1_9BACT|nr:hypothetical protein DC20_14535 [Rufibacter tibetensis]
MTEKEFSGSLLENTPDGIVAFDTQFQVTAWNRAMEKIMSTDRETVMGKSVLSFFPEEKRRYLQLRLSRVFQGHHITTYALPGLSLDRRFKINVVPLTGAEEEVAGVLVILHEITQQIERQHQTAVQDLLVEQHTADNAFPNQKQEERALMTETLHQRLGQYLFAAKLNLEDLLQKTPSKQPAHTPSLTRINHMLEEAIKETRNLGYELLPKPVERYGLRTALQDLAQQLSSEKVWVQCVVSGFEQHVEAQLENSLLGIVQDLLNSTLQNAWVKEVLVQVLDKGHQIIVRVECNGTRTPFFTTEGGSSDLNLSFLQYKVKPLQGTIHVSSTPEDGRVITLLLNRKADPNRSSFTNEAPTTGRHIWV